jgi:hypothetical protein
MSNGEKPKATNCPNCLKPAIRAGNEITCEACDAVFIVTKKQGAKVKELGPIEDHEERIAALEQYHKPQEPKPAAEPKTDDEPDEEDL